MNKVDAVTIRCTDCGSLLKPCDEADPFQNIIYFRFYSGSNFVGCGHVSADGRTSLAEEESGEKNKFG